MEIKPENRPKRTLIGRVTSDKRQATRTVKVEWSRRHPEFDKVMRYDTVYHVHDPDHASKLGDLVEIMEVRPISKTKTWQLVQVLETAK